MEELLMQVISNLEGINAKLDSISNANTVATLDAKQAAKYLGISYYTLLENINNPDLSERIPHFRIGTKILLRKEALNLWMQNMEGQSVLPEKEVYTAVQGIRRIRE